MPRKPLNTQTQQLVFNLCEYFLMEKVNRGPLLPVSSVQERVANALMISRKTVYSIKKRKENQPFFSSPGKSRSRPKPKTTDFPEVTKMAVRNTLYDMYKERKYVTLKSLNTELRNKQIVFLGKTSLNILLKELGFKYKKDDNRRALIEKTAISSLRACFLRKYMENRNSTYPRKVIFLDETWIYSKGNKTISWQDENVKSVRKPEGYDDKRFIVVHAGSSTGVVPMDKGESTIESSLLSEMDYLTSGSKIQEERTKADMKITSSSATLTASETEVELLKTIANPSTGLSLSSNTVGQSSEFKGKLRLVEVPQKRKRYIGDLSSDDFATPKKAKQNFRKIRDTVVSQSRKIKSLQTTVKRLRLRTNTLKDLLKLLKEKSLISYLLEISTFF